jgi:hypothetical protein
MTRTLIVILLSLIFLSSSFAFAWELEKKWGKECKKKYKKNSDEYNQCIIDWELWSINVQFKIGQMMREDERKKAKELTDKLFKMTPDERRGYNCSEKFGFKKGSDKFKDCIFKIYQAELELEKLELQKELLKSQIELAKANAYRQDRLAQAQTEAAKMQSLAAKQQANSARTAETLALLNMSLKLLTPPAAPPINKTTCSFNGRFMNCF